MIEKKNTRISVYCAIRRSNMMDYSRLDKEGLCEEIMDSCYSNL